VYDNLIEGIFSDFVEFHINNKKRGASEVRKPKKPIHHKSKKQKEDNLARFYRKKFYS